MVWNYLICSDQFANSQTDQQLDWFVGQFAMTSSHVLDLRNRSLKQVKSVHLIWKNQQRLSSKEGSVNSSRKSVAYNGLGVCSVPTLVVGMMSYTVLYAISIYEASINQFSEFDECLADI